MSIKSINDLMRCINLASLLEISGWPKPGNVHRTKDFDNTRFEHFLAGIAAIQPNFRDLCERTYNNCNKFVENYSFIELGTFFRESAKNMMKWQYGGNVILGHILILAPLSAATIICLKTKKTYFKDFTFNIKKIIKDSTVKDTINLYKAIKICNPGGLGKIEKYDIFSESSIEEIQKDNVNLAKIFELSKDYDSISLEYCNGFDIILNKGLPYYFNIFHKTKNINSATVNTFLKILAEHIDTLIVRKSGLEEALYVSKCASKILKTGGITSKRGLKSVKELDSYLQSKHGLLNPGSTADLVAGVILSALIFGLRF